MTLTINHVGIPTRDLDASVEFYIDLFGAEHCERIPTPDSPGFRVQWLRLGDRELHIFEIDVPVAPRQYHFAVSAAGIDQFHRAYRLGKAGGFLDSVSFHHHVFETPRGEVQLFLIDPTGNMVELDWEHAGDVDPTVVTDLVRIADFVPQSDDGRRATLYPERLGEAAAP